MDRNEAYQNPVSTSLIVSILIVVILINLFMMILPGPSSEMYRDPRLQGEKNMTQGCYPWDDEYEEDGKDESRTGNDDWHMNEEDCEKGVFVSKKSNGSEEQVPMLSHNAIKMDYASVTAPKKSLTSQDLSDSKRFKMRPTE